MHVLALVNQKGGGGKTAAAVHLAAALARRGERVCLVDLDPQAHATLALGCAAERTPLVGVLEVLRGEASARAALRPVPGGFELLPASVELASFEEAAARSPIPERALLVALAELGSHCDFVVIDCPPRVDGVLAANALCAADTAVLVVECGALALRAAMRALAVLRGLFDELASPASVRALATRFDPSSPTAREILIALQARFGALLFDTVIRTSEQLREAVACARPVELLDPLGRACADFASLADEVVALAASSATLARSAAT